MSASFDIAKTVGVYSMKLSDKISKGFILSIWYYLLGTAELLLYTWGLIDHIVLLCDIRVEKYLPLSTWDYIDKSKFRIQKILLA